MVFERVRILFVSAALLAPCAQGHAASGGSAWSYSTSHDELRQRDVDAATINSLNAVPLTGSHGWTRASLRIFNGGRGLEVGFITGGRFDCPMKGCQISVSFDGGPVERVPAARLTPGDYGYMQVAMGDRFAHEIASSASMIVELPLQPDGQKQFEFRIAGLQVQRLGDLPPPPPVRHAPPQDGEMQWTDPAMNPDVTSSRPPATP